VQALGVTALLGGGITVSVVVGPRAINAAVGSEDAGPREVTPAVPKHQQTLRALRMMLEHSEGLIAIHGGSSGSPRGVLWYADTNNDGLPGVTELVVLTHHGVAGTVVAYAADPGAHSNTPIDPGIVSSAGFAERWTFRDDMTARVVASGVTELRLERLAGGADDDGAGRVVLGLQWAPNESEGTPFDDGLVTVALADAPFAGDGEAR
jgi:hypothetical protein